MVHQNDEPSRLGAPGTDIPMISFPPDAYCGFPHILWQMLYGLGARKVVMIGVPVLGCSPSARIAVPSQLGQCLTAGNQLALGFNAGLKQLVDGFHTTLPDFKLVYANSYDPVSDMISNPRAYGMCKLYGVSCQSYYVNLVHEFFQQHLVCLYSFISICTFLVLHGNAMHPKVYTKQTTNVVQSKHPSIIFQQPIDEYTGRACLQLTQVNAIWGLRSYSDGLIMCRAHKCNSSMLWSRSSWGWSSMWEERRSKPDWCSTITLLTSINVPFLGSPSSIWACCETFVSRILEW